MTITKVFQSGSFQVVRLPETFRFETKEVFITQEGDKIILSPKQMSWSDYFSAPPAVPQDFFTDRQDSSPGEQNIF